MTTFNDTTITALRDRANFLREALAELDGHVTHHRERTKHYQGIANQRRAELADYEALLAFTESVNANEANAETDENAGAYTKAQMLGEACARCGNEFELNVPHWPSGQHYDGYPLFVHYECPGESEAGR